MSINPYFSYPGIELWDRSTWESKLTPFAPLAAWIGENDPAGMENEPLPRCCTVPEIPEQAPWYQKKTWCLDDPSVVAYWKAKGLNYRSMEMGKTRWVSMVPDKALTSRERTMPTLLIFHLCRWGDPYWAMRTLAHFEKELEMASREQILVFFVCKDVPDYKRDYSNVLQEALVLYPGDMDKVYVHVGELLNKGLKISDAKNYRYTDKAGNPLNPDDCIEYMGSEQIPVLDISRRWEDRDSLNRNLAVSYEGTIKGFSLDRLIHSETGARMAESFGLEYRFTDCDDPAMIAEFDSYGLKLQTHDTAGERWISVVPKNALESGEKLPCVLVFHECNYTNDHLGVKGLSCFYEFVKFAAQGECMLIEFALEGFDQNELLCDIVKEAEALYPIDRTRYYTIGHSHNGEFAAEFGRRHADWIAGIAMTGDSTILPEPAKGLGAFSCSNETAEKMEHIDMPTINIRGSTEGRCKDDALQVKYWQRRLKMSRCPVRSDADCYASFTSTDKVERMIGVPFDRTEIRHIDGFDQYIGDVQNIDGKWLLRIVEQEALPHMTTPSMQDLAWDFLRKFARNLETGETVELEKQ